MKFPYRKFPASPIPTHSDRKNISRPVIPIKLINKQSGKEVNIYAIIDSGADYCIFHAEIGEIMGLDIKNAPKMEFKGTGGTPQYAFFHNIILSVGGSHFECYAGFTYDFDKQQLPYGILGQDGFFNKFKITLDYSKTEIEIKEVSGIKFSPFKKTFQTIST